MQWGTGGSFLNLGVIQQLRGPNFTQFWPTSPLEWTVMEILHILCSCDQNWTFYWPTIHLIFSTWLLKDPFSCLYPINYLVWCYKISPNCLKGWAPSQNTVPPSALPISSFWKEDWSSTLFGRTIFWLEFLFRLLAYSFLSYSQNSKVVWF